MMDLDTRARTAGSGLRRAADRFALPEPTPTRAPRRRGTIAFVAALTVAAVLAIAWIATRGDTTRVDTVTTRPTTGITSTQVGGYPIHITVDRLGAWVDTQQNEAVRLDPRTGSPVARVPTASPVRRTFTDPELGVWILGGGDGGAGLAGGDIMFLGPWTDRPPFTMHLANPPTGIAFARGTVWVADSGAHLRRVDPSTDRTLVEIATGADDAAPGQLVFAGGRLWLHDTDRLLAFDPARGAPVALPASPVGNIRSIATDGRWLWLSMCTRACVLERHDPRTGALLQRYAEQPLAKNDGGEGTIVAANGAVWAIAAKGPTLIRATPDGKVRSVMRIPTKLRSTDRLEQFRYFGVGAGALWYSVPERGLVYRIPLP